MTAEDPVCSECTEEPSIYQCPRCNVRTCSLSCVKLHKERTGCNGKRDRGAFLPLCRMSDKTLSSDYFFLEEVLNQMPSNKKRCRSTIATSTTSNSRTKNTTEQQAKQLSILDLNPHHRSPPLSKKWKKLLQQSQNRGIHLKLMPAFMERHRLNTSWYCAPRNLITWKVEVHLLFSTNASSSTGSTGSTAERQEKRIFSFRITEDEQNLLDHVYKHARAENGVTMPDCPAPHCLFLKQQPNHSDAKPTSPPSTNSGTCYYVAIEAGDSLRAKLQDQVVIEHPTLFCVPVDRVNEFRIQPPNVTEVSSPAEDT